MLMPGSFLVLTASQLGFALSELGDDVFLLEMNGTNIIRILDDAEVPAAARQESVGLFQRSDGTFDFTELRANTSAGANALPRVGPVVISEIMFTPQAGKAEFIELANLTGAPVPLFDTIRPTNVWQLDGVGSFSFPAGTVLDACATLIVCSTNPAAFQAQYTVSPSVQVFGPWTGTLDDDGESLKLLQPGSPEPDGTVPYYRADHVAYRTNAPWPQAISGTSLERIPLEAFGNDPAYWRTGLVGGTPGTPAANRPPIISVTGKTAVPQLTPLTLALSVADLDVPWQTVNLVAALSPVGSTFDPLTGNLSWTPSTAQGPGDFTARFTATDTSACGTNQTWLEFVIQVIQPLTVNVQFVSGGVEMNFPVLAGETYRVEYCTDLVTADWQLLQEITATQTTIFTVADLEPVQGPARFYRVLWAR